MASQKTHTSVSAEMRERNHTYLHSRENPDVIYLQEVVPRTVKIIEDNCPTYQLIPGGVEEYFTAIMLKVCFRLLLVVQLLSYKYPGCFSSCSHQSNR